MKEEIILRAIGGVDDALIEEAATMPNADRKKARWAKWGFAAAACLLFLTAVFVVPGTLKSPKLPPAASAALTDPAEPDATAEPAADTPDASESEAPPEIAFEMRYAYSIDGGRFASYVGGRVIEAQRVGGKLEDATVTAGWTNAVGERLTEEHARAEIFAIDGVSPDVAAAIKFIDKLEAQTTEHFYVILSPDADLTPVRDYVITTEPLESSDPVGEIAE